MSSTRERDALPKTLSRCIRLMFSSTEASTSQWESSVFVSPIKAPRFDDFGRVRSRRLKRLLGYDCVDWHGSSGRPSEDYGNAEHTTVRSEEHTSELQSRGHLVCRLLLEKKKKIS